MIRSGEAQGREAQTPDAQILWRAALGLDREARIVSGSVRVRPPLLFFTDPLRTPEPWITAAKLPAGAGVVYRSFGASDAMMTARRLRAVTADRGVTLLIGLDADLAEQVRADGVHLPERALLEAQGLRAAHPDWLLTAALHDPATTGEAFDALDALVLSPIFPAGGASASKAALGVAALSQARLRTGRPAYALGGVTAATVGALEGSGACGIAAIDGVVKAFT